MVLTISCAHAHGERNNLTALHEWPGLVIFQPIAEVQQVAFDWLWTYSNECPNMNSTNSLLPCSRKRPRKLYGFAPPKRGGLPMLLSEKKWLD
jgi:hypothetical protein